MHTSVYKREDFIKKKIIMILLFIALILSISASCANDNISLDENEDILTSQDFNEVHN